MTFRFVECVSMQWCVKSHCAHVTVIVRMQQKLQNAQQRKKMREEKEDVEAKAENGEQNGISKIE